MASFRRAISIRIAGILASFFHWFLDLAAVHDAFLADLERQNEWYKGQPRLLHKLQFSKKHQDGSCAICRKSRILEFRCEKPRIFKIVFESAEAV